MPNANGHGPKRAILYARVSTDEQVRSGYSLAQQMEALREHAAREGYEVLEEVTDPGESGGFLERPGLDRVRDLVAGNPGGVSVVLAQDMDRWSREPAHVYVLGREFEQYGCRLQAITDWDDGSPQAEMLRTIRGAVSKYERSFTAERSRRGKLKKAREGKIIANNCANYGFVYNENRDGFLVDEERMAVVRRVFRMVSVEGMSLRGVVNTLNREGLPVPHRGWNKSARWGVTFVRDNIVKDDVYRPHTYEEIATLVTPGVANGLDKDKRYGIWWFNKARYTVTKKVPVIQPDGTTKYRKHKRRVPLPREQWIAVPVPDSGVARETVDAARAAIKDNRKPSSAGHRFWELSGGILRCGLCGRRMATTSHQRKREGPRYYYYRCGKRWEEGACEHDKHHNAPVLEGRVWDYISSLLKNPERLRTGLERVIEDKRMALRGDPEREIRAWHDKLSEADQERRGWLRLAAKGRVTDEDLDRELAELEETRKIAYRELSNLEDRRQRIEELELEKEVLLEHYAKITPEGLDLFTPADRHDAYKALQLRVTIYPDGGPELNWNLDEELDVRGIDTVQARAVLGGHGRRLRRPGHTGRLRKSAGGAGSRGRAQRRRCPRVCLGGRALLRGVGATPASRSRDRAGFSECSTGSWAPATSAN